MTAQTAYFCDVCKRPGVHLDIPVGEHEVPVSGDEVEVRKEIAALDLCVMCLARELGRLLAPFSHEDRRVWIARVRSADGALHGR